MYHLVNELLEPQRLLLLTLAACLAVLLRRRPDDRRQFLWAIVPLTLLCLVSLPVTARFAREALEGPYRPLRTRPTEAKCIVVLSGYALPRDPRRPEPLLGEDTLYRCLHAADLYHRGPHCPVVLCGGFVHPEKDMPSLAEQMRDFLLKLGVADEDLILEKQSTTTYENAVQCAAVLQAAAPGPIVLVTDATHMARAERCFRHAGFQVVPAACQMQNERWEWSITDFLPCANAAAGVNDVLHETLGLIWYKLKGRIA